MAGHRRPGKSPGVGQGPLPHVAGSTTSSRIVEEKLVDIMLMSASHQRGATIEKRIFDNSPVTPAARANDTTDIHIIRGGVTPAIRRLPFRTATLDHIQCGRAECKPEERGRGIDLGLYDITFNNDTVLDRASALEEYKAFRLEAERKGFRHFLEIFDPNRPEAVEASQVPAFINDAIDRTLGGVTRPAGRSSSRWSTTAPRRWRSWSATTRTSSSASSGDRPAPPMTASPR